MELNELILGSSGEEGLYPEEGLIIGCIFWLTGRWAFNRGGLGLITGSLRYLTFLVWHHVQKNGADRDERNLGLRLVIDQIFLFCVGAGVYRKAPRSFLFSLVNPSGLPPTKIPLIAGKGGNAIYCHNNYGPSFGSDDGLRIVSASNSYNCSISLNNSYQCPTGQNADTFFNRKSEL